MMRLLKIELLKLLPYKTFRVLFLTYLVLLFSILLVADNFFGSIGAPKEQVLQFPNIWNYYTFCGGYLNIILVVIIIFITCNEFTYRTLRQNIIDGLTRNEVVLSKIYLIVFLAVIITIALFITGLIAGTMNGTIPGGGNFTDHLEFVFAFFIQTIGVMSLGYLLGNLFKRSAIAIVIFLILLFPVDLILREAVLPGWAAAYLPVNTYFWNLPPIPKIHILSHGEEPTENLPTLLSLAVGSVYILIFFTTNWLLIRRRDL